MAPKKRGSHELPLPPRGRFSALSRYVHRVSMSRIYMLFFRGTRFDVLCPLSFGERTGIGVDTRLGMCYTFLMVARIGVCHETGN